MKLKKTSLITRGIPISVMFKCGGKKNNTRKPVIFQTLRNENYILISETLKCEEKNSQHQWNLCHLIFRGSLQRGKHHLCVSQTKWKPHSESMMDVLAPGMGHSHAPRPLITWQIRDMLSTFSYSPSLDFLFPHIPRWVPKLALHLGENSSYIKIYGINQHWHSCSKDFSVLT